MSIGCEFPKPVMGSGKVIMAFSGDEAALRTWGRTLVAGLEFQGHQLLEL